jgi:hypothetical protein
MLHSVIFILEVGGLSIMEDCPFILTWEFWRNQIVISDMLISFYGTILIHIYNFRTGMQKSGSETHFLPAIKRRMNDYSLAYSFQISMSSVF